MLGLLQQLLESLRPLRKLLELINPRYDSVLRHTYEQSRRTLQMSMGTSFTAGRFAHVAAASCCACLPCLESCL